MGTDRKNTRHTRRQYIPNCILDHCLRYRRVCEPPLPPNLNCAASQTDPLQCGHVRAKRLTFCVSLGRPSPFHLIGFLKSSKRSPPGAGLDPAAHPPYLPPPPTQTLRALGWIKSSTAPLYFNINILEPQTFLQSIALVNAPFFIRPSSRSTSSIR